MQNPEVRAWLKGIFRPSGTNNKERKIAEDLWGHAFIRSARPDLNPPKMWTGMFGQILIEEIFPNGWKPKNMNGHEPDWETPDFVIEVKTQTWFTEGTAGEKILGVPVKYRNVPTLYGKPLRIVLFGRAENIWFDIPKDPALEKIIDFWKSMGIEYVRGSDFVQ